MSLRALLATCIFSVLTTQVSAVTLNPDGVGEVLLFPYYTVNGGNATLLSLSNNTERVKAVKVRFRESRNHKRVMFFNLYLAPRDTWTAAVISLEEDGPAVIKVEDPSCTVPRISGRDPAGLGEGLVPFRTFFFLPDFGAGTSETRTREGMIEIIEMGEVAFDLDDPDADLLGNFALHTSSERPEDCDRLEAAWTIGGVWIDNPQQDMSQPTGGLSGAVSIINVLGGYQLSNRPAAISGFYNPGEGMAVSLHSSFDFATPDLNSAASGAVDEPVSASVLNNNGEVVQLFFDRPVDAVSAVLMRDSVANEFTFEPVIAAATEWVLSFPTRQHYVSETEALPPFISPIVPESSPGVADAAAAEPSSINAWNRNTRQLIRRPPPGNPPDPPPPPIPRDLPTPIMRYASNVFAANQENIGLPSVILGSADFSNLDLDFVSEDIENGFAQILFRDENQSMLDNSSTFRLRGLPVIGFAVQRALNGTLLDRDGNRVLSTYTTSFRHLYTRDNVEDTNR